jgi:3-phosphoshikimate 1-carboxyvinyltransferase
MGANVQVEQDQIQIIGGSPLKAIDVDSRDIPDLVPVLAALACYAKGTTLIHDAERLRLKESDRLTSLFVELRKMGADVTMNESSLTIKGPAKLHGATIDPHNDHRIAMACAVAALQAEGATTIQNGECIRKSYPQFFNDIAMLGADVVGGKFDR